MNKIKIKFIMIISSFFIPPLSFSQDSISIQNQLSSQSVFSIGNNGFIGSINEGERIYLSILKRDDAPIIFTSIIKSKNSTPEGKMYALCGLKKTKTPLTEIKTLNTGQYKNITTLRGDVLRRESFNNLYLSIIDHGC
jgi:hypothetical protein